MENKTENFNVTDLANDAKRTFEVLEQLFSSVPENQLDINPSENSWSVGQTMEHILKAISGFDDFIKENVTETDRPIGEKIQALKSLFLNFTIKMESPEFIRPVENKHDKQEQLNALKACKNEVLLSINNLDLSKTCLNFELPTFGYLTRLEWVNFALFHIQRHTQQIKNILVSLNN